MSILSPATNDQSIYYLGQLFGTVGSVLTPTNPSILIGAMFKTFNTSALILGSMIVVYIIIVGLLKTAGEGTFLGKDWNSVWVPVRTIMGIAALFPTSSGYSVIQIILIWIILQGVAAADLLWTTVLSFISVTGSPYAGVGMPATADVSTNFHTLFQALTCEASAVGRDVNQNQVSGNYYQDTYTAGDGSQHPYYFCSDPKHIQSNFCTNASPQLSSLPATAPSSGSACTVAPGYTTQPVGGFGPSVYHPAMINCNIGPMGGACGMISYGDPDDACTGPNSSAMKCASYQAQVSALNSVLATYAPLAAQFAQYDHDYLAFTKNINPSPPIIYQPSPGITYNWQTPSWLQSFCQSGMGSAMTACCTYGGSTSGGTCWPLGKQPFLLPFTQAATNTADFGNPPNDVVKNLLWPYGIQPSLIGQNSEPGGAAQSMSATNFIQGAVSTYTAIMNTATAAEVNELVAANQGNLSGWEATAQSVGWIMAGSYYFQIAQMNNNNLSDAVPSFNVTGNDPSTSSTRDDTSLYPYRNNYAAANDLVSIVLNQGQSASAFTSTPQLSQVGSNLNGLASGIMSVFMDALTGASSGQQATNPLYAMQSLGEKLILTAEITFLVFFVSAVVILILASLNIMGLGTGLTSNPLKPGMKFFLMTTMTLLLALLGWMITMGGILAVYTPLIPYVIFSLGAIGWFIATIEALVAGPFIALGILWPGGEHEILGRSHHGTMILFNILLRPSLMIMGMMASMLLIPVLLTMLNAGFTGVMSAIMPNPLILELVFFISAYIMLVVTIVDKCFSLIHWLPAKVLTYLRAEVMGAGEEQGLKEVKGGVESTMQGVGSAVTAMGEGVKGQLDSLGKAFSNQKNVTPNVVAPPTAAEENKAELDEMPLGLADEAEHASTEETAKPADANKGKKGGDPAKKAAAKAAKTAAAAAKVGEENMEAGLSEMPGYVGDEPDSPEFKAMAGKAKATVARNAKAAKKQEAADRKKDIDELPGSGDDEK